jgi:Tol biopolymer transport system component
MARLPQQLLLTAGLLLVCPIAGFADPEIRQYHGFIGPIRNLAFSPDGQLVAAGGCHQTIRLWDRQTGKPVRSLDGHENWALCVAFSPDSKTLASAGFDSTVRLWDVATGKQLHVLEGHRAPRVHFVTFSPDGKTVASACWDNTIGLWDVATGKLKKQLVGHNSNPCVVLFAPNGKTLASGAGDPKVLLWDAATGRILSELPGHGGYVTALAFAPDGQTLYSGCHDGMIRRFEIPGGKKVQEWSGQDGWARTFSLSADGRTLAVANEKGTVRLWEVASQKVRRSYKTDTGYTWAVAFAPGGKAVASGGDDQTVRLWDVTAVIPARGGKPLEYTAQELDDLWAALNDRIAGKAYSAMWTLAAVPRLSLPLLAKHLKPEKPVPVDAMKVEQWIKELDDDKFEVREKASDELGRLGKAVEAKLLKALKEGTPSAEQRTRLSALLEKLDGLPISLDELRATRGTETLEQIGTPEARRLLAELARGPADCVFTRQARASLERLDRQGKKGP